MEKIKSGVSLIEAQEVMYDQDDFDYSIIRPYGGGKVFMEINYIRIPELQIDIHYAEMHNYNRSTKEYELSYSFYIFLKPNLKVNKILYSEYGSGLEVSISNYLYTKGVEMDMDEIEKMKCDVYVG